MQVVVASVTVVQVFIPPLPAHVPVVTDFGNYLPRSGCWNLEANELSVGIKFWTSGIGRQTDRLV